MSKGLFTAAVTASLLLAAPAGAFSLFGDDASRCTLSINTVPGVANTVEACYSNPDMGLANCLQFNTKVVSVPAFIQTMMRDKDCPGIDISGNAQNI